MHIHSKLCITVRFCGFFSQYFLKNKYHHFNWWQKNTQICNWDYLQLPLAIAFIFTKLNLLSFFKLTSKSFKMIVVWVLVCFSFNNAKWVQVHMDLFFRISYCNTFHYILAKYMNEKVWDLQWKNIFHLTPMLNVIIIIYWSFCGVK